MATILEVLRRNHACKEGLDYAKAHEGQTPAEFFDGCKADPMVWLELAAAAYFCIEFSIHLGGSCLCLADHLADWSEVRQRFIEVCEKE